jgi:ABC-type uncharacterized transport system substrate-binding protein
VLADQEIGAVKKFIRRLQTLSTSFLLSRRWHRLCHLFNDCTPALIGCERFVAKNSSRKRSTVAKKIGLLAIAIGVLASAYPTHAQQPARKVPRIGILTLGTAPSIGAFLQGLHELGWLEGQNIAIVYRSAGGNEERLSAVAAQLVGAHVDIIVSTSSRGTVAARQVTKSIPIVATVVAERLVNLGHPKDNVTGVFSMPRELSGKRLELLKEIIPRVSQIAVLANADDPAQVKWIKIDAVALARSLGVQIQILNVEKPEEIENAFTSMVRGNAGALSVQTSANFVLNRTRIVQLAAKNLLPTMYVDSRFTDSGGLVSYGPNDAEMYRRAAYFVDRILKGAKPADLPVEQPTKFELVINLNTAKTLGLTIPPKVLTWADRVIE